MKKIKKESGTPRKRSRKPSSALFHDCTVTPRIDRLNRAVERLEVNYANERKYLDARVDSLLAEINRIDRTILNVDEPEPAANNQTEEILVACEARFKKRCEDSLKESASKVFVTGLTHQPLKVADFTEKQSERRGYGKIAGPAIDQWVKGSQPPPKKVEHSQLPWRTQCGRWVMDSNDKTICRCSVPGEPLGLDASNARLIVESVNQHPNLVKLREAGKDLAEAMQGMVTETYRTEKYISPVVTAQLSHFQLLLRACQGDVKV